MSCDFQQLGILTSIDSDKPVQPPVKLRNSKCCSVGSLQSHRDGSFVHPKHMFKLMDKKIIANVRNFFVA